MDGTGDTAEVLWSADQTSDFLGVTKGTLWRKRRDGTGPEYVRLSDVPGGKIVYKRSVVMAWLEARTEHEYAGAKAS